MSVRIENVLEDMSGSLVAGTPWCETRLIQSVLPKAALASAAPARHQVGPVPETGPVRQ
jgi:hypothetical protein